MDKQGNIKEHSKEKLNVYKEYLKAYLSVMSKVHYFKNIYIVEPFAGKGVVNSGEEGSAMIARDIMLSFENNKNKSVFLRLNDLEFCDELKKNLSPLPGDNKITVLKLDANEFIKEVLSETENKNNHRFFFIDPFGYTQIREEVYEMIFKAERLEFLIFIPVFHIYRFLRKEEYSELLKPIADFLKDMGIDEKNAKETKKVEDFANKIKSSFIERTGTGYVYYKLIKSEKPPNKYALFFVTRNILGAEKFLEVLDKIKDKDLFENIISDQDSDFIEVIRNEKRKLTNCRLYEIGILNGLLPKKVNTILKELEKKNKIIVKPKIEKRKKGIFYIGYEYYKNNQEKLEIIYKHGL